MNIDFIIKDLEHTISYFQEPLTEMQIGRLYQAKETLSQIKMLSRGDINKTVCDHNWIDGRVTLGTEVCTKCNDARLKQNVLSSGVCKGNHYKNGVCSKYFGWCTEEQCDYWQKEL